MLPNLIDLIIIFESWVMGILQQFILPSWDEGFFIAYFVLWWAYPFNYFELAFISLKYSSCLSILFDRFLVLHATYIRCFEIYDLTLSIDSC